MKEHFDLPRIIPESRTKTHEQKLQGEKSQLSEGNNFLSFSCSNIGWFILRGGISPGLEMVRYSVGCTRKRDQSIPAVGGSLTTFQTLPSLLFRDYEYSSLGFPSMYPLFPILSRLYSPEICFSLGSSGFLS